MSFIDFNVSGLLEGAIEHFKSLSYLHYVNMIVLFQLKVRWPMVTSWCDYCTNVNDMVRPTQFRWQLNKLKKYHMYCLEIDNNNVIY